MNIDPKITFYIGLATCIALVGSNASLWVGAIPEVYTHILAAWNNIIATFGTAVMTFLSGMNSTKTSQIANVAAMPDVKRVIAVDHIANGTLAADPKVTTT